MTMLGKKHSETTIQKIKESRRILIQKRGYVNSPETKQKIGLAFKGKPIPEERRLRIIESLIGNKRNLGNIRSIESRIKQSKSYSGTNHYNWKGGISPVNERIRKSVELRLWREAVFSRDSFTCRKCLKVGGELNAHHIQNFSEYPSLRFAIDNGVTFCKDCHYIFHVRFGRKKNNLKQLKEFI